MTINPMQSAHDAPRCKAKSKRTGKRCRAPRFAAVASVECMGLKVARRLVTRMGLSARCAHERGDPSSEVRQLAVALGAQMLKWPSVRSSAFR